MLSASKSTPTSHRARRWLVSLAGLAALLAGWALFEQTHHAVGAVLLGQRTIMFLETTAKSGNTTQVVVAACMLNQVDLFDKKMPTPWRVYVAGDTGLELVYRNGKHERVTRPWALHFSPSHHQLQLFSGTVVGGSLRSTSASVGLGKPTVSKALHEKLCGPAKDRSIWRPPVYPTITVKYDDAMRQPVVLEDVAAMITATRAYISYAWGILLLDGALLAAALLWWHVRKLSGRDVVAPQCGTMTLQTADRSRVM